MYKIVIHSTNKPKKHQLASFGELLYQILGTNSEHTTTWEPISHFFSCHKRKVLYLSTNVEDLIDG